jgi:DNA topoisomerase-1
LSDSLQHIFIMSIAHPKLPAEMRRIGLRYVSDAAPGLARLKRGKGFCYADARGKAIADAETLERIRRLVIPPAWTGVWICKSADGHLQATGRDARGRKQYRYHADYRSHQDDTKFSSIVDFALALPGMRRRVNRDLNLRGLPRERVLALVVQLLERTLIRVGNQEYAEHNHSFGLSTLLNQHASHCGAGVRFTFIGKSGVQHNVEVADHRLAKIVFNCRDLPGQHLFEFKDDGGKVHAISSAEVNGYIQDCSGKDFSAKNFRTWRGTVIAALAFERLERPASATASRKLVAQVVKDVALELRNTPATCRKYYIHPKLIEAFEGRSFASLMKRARAKAEGNGLRGLTMNERAVLAFIQS